MPVAKQFWTHSVFGLTSLLFWSNCMLGRISRSVFEEQLYYRPDAFNPAMSAKALKVCMGSGDVMCSDTFVDFSTI